MIEKFSENYKLMRFVRNRLSKSVLINYINRLDEKFIYKALTKLMKKEEEKLLYVEENYLAFYWINCIKINNVYIAIKLECKFRKHKELWRLN